MASIERIGDDVATLGECPVWSPLEHVLYWADIEGLRLHRYDPSNGERTARDLPGRPGSFGLTDTEGTLVVALETALVSYEWSTATVEELVVIEDPALGNRSNDGRCDPKGRYVVGTMWPVPEEDRYTGGLYTIDDELTVTKLAADVGIPNSLVFDAQRSRMYWADTFHATIWRWDYNLETGERSNKQEFFNYRKNPDARGLPDGACLDADGCLWSASVHGWALTRITPAGTVDRVVELPIAMPTMPAFGGADLSTIYVTSIDGGMVDQRRSNGVPAGALLAVDGIGVQGLPETPFARYPLTTDSLSHA